MDFWSAGYGSEFRRVKMTPKNPQRDIRLPEMETRTTQKVQQETREKQNTFAIQYLAKIGEAGGAYKGFRVAGTRHQGVQEQVLVGGGQLTQLTGSAHQRLTNLNQ
jgi:hypothetical protein